MQKINTSLNVFHTSTALISLHCGWLWIIASLFIFANCQVLLRWAESTQTGEQGQRVSHRSHAHAHAGHFYRFLWLKCVKVQLCKNCCTWVQPFHSVWFQTRRTGKEGCFSCTDPVAALDGSVWCMIRVSSWRGETQRFAIWEGASSCGKDLCMSSEFQRQAAMFPLQTFVSQGFYIWLPLRKKGREKHLFQIKSSDVTFIKIVT